MPVEKSPEQADSQMVVAVDIYEGNHVNLLKKYDYPLSRLADVGTC